jgi:carbon monoxide dehydrogenase subunit G
MEISAEFPLNAPRQRAWERMQDSERLRQCIPGCEDLAQSSPTAYLITASLGIGPVRGRFQGTVTITEQHPPNSLTMAVDGQGPTGFVRGIASVTLSEAGAVTIAHVTANIDVGGLLARLGQRAIAPVADSLMRQFFTCLAS